MAQEIANQTNFIPLRDMEMIGIHPTLKYYLIILKNQRMWYAKEFKADEEGLTGEFHEDRF